MLSLDSFLLDSVFGITQLVSILLFANAESRRSRFSLRASLCAGSAILYAAVKAHSVQAGFFVNFLFYSGMYLLSLLWYCICIRDPVPRGLYNFYSGLLLRLAASSLSNFPLLFLPDSNLLAEMNWLIVPLIHLLVAVTLLMLADRLIVSEIRHNRDFQPGKLSLGLMVAMTSVLLLYLGYTENAIGIPMLYYGIRAFFCLVILALFYLVWKSAQEYAQESMQRQINEEKLRHYSELGDVIQTMNIKAHDLRHQIRTLETGSVVTPEVISDLTETVKNYETYVQTGNSALDVILTDAVLRCEREHVEANFTVAGELLSFISPLDLNALFGNAIDNALEYLKTVPKADRIFWITCGASNGFIRLRFENFLAEPIVLSASGLPQTTKADPSCHGFGTQSILAIAQKYGGSAAFDTDDGVFTVCVVLPVPV